MTEKPKRNWVPNPKGPDRLPEEIKRNRTVSSRFNDAELRIIDEKRGHLSKGEFLRNCALGYPVPRPIPEINREAWSSLAKVHGTLETIAKFYSQGAGSEIDTHLVRELVHDLRKKLIGLDFE